MRVITQWIFAVDNEAGRDLKFWHQYRHWCAENNLFWTEFLISCLKGWSDEIL